MSEVEKLVRMDIWFYNLPASWQEEITGIMRADYNVDSDAETYDDDVCYEFFDNSVAEWWDSHTYEEKLAIFEREGGEI